MKILDKDKDGNAKFLGIPVGISGAYSKEARRAQFEPRNPKLFVGRKFGAGWDLNMGALAVKLGLVGPNASLEDVESDIPEEVVRALRIAPLVGAGAVAAVALVIGSTSRKLPTAWNWKLLPKEFGSARSAVLPHALAAVSAGAWSALQNKQDSGVDAVVSAQALGLQTTALLMMVAAVRGGLMPKVPCPMVILGPLATPGVATAVLSKTVNAALENRA